MKNMKINKKSMGSKKGFTLMELLLVTALLGVITAASTGILYWQMRVQSHVTQNAVLMNKLVNTQMMMRKVLRSIPPASLTLDVDVIKCQKDSTTQVDLFSFAANTLKYDNDPILDGIIASFTIATTPAALPFRPMETTDLIRIELTTMGRERRNISFLVRPRGQ